ncbi:MAG TPA: hypothetical protein PKC69_11105 [Chitinophagaceae bacterium]|nr:hypothetical protein [Chitinophagaceae bacterium]
MFGYKVAGRYFCGRYDKNDEAYKAHKETLRWKVCVVVCTSIK